MVAGRIDNGFIDPSKPVADKADDLSKPPVCLIGRIIRPFIPDRARPISPGCRAAESDPGYNVGYVFLYFYGLERRFFIDNPDRDERKAIIAEVGRLLDVYGLERIGSQLHGLVSSKRPDS